MYSFSAEGIKTQDRRPSGAEDSFWKDQKEIGTRFSSNPNVFSFQFAVAYKITIAVLPIVT